MAINFNRAEFVLSAVRQGAFIRDGRAQVTFAGRSNVGKSSVINRLLNRKNFARVGATPGKTTQVNYFLIDGKIYFTDLPGYGYAKVSKDERDRAGHLLAVLHFSGPERAGLLHADPHPGNFRLLPDRRLAVLDFGSSQAMPRGWPPRLGPLLAAVPKMRPATTPSATGC